MPATATFRKHFKFLLWYELKRLSLNLPCPLADFKPILKLLEISATTVWDGELMISYNGTDLHFVMQGMKTCITGQGRWRMIRSRET